MELRGGLRWPNNQREECGNENEFSCYSVWYCHVFRRRIATVGRLERLGSDVPRGGRIAYRVCPPVSRGHGLPAGFTATVVVFRYFCLMPTGPYAAE
jgi:hypothetical protein